MLTKVELSNYRGFKSYRMEGLAQVNLFVGKNNSGKTALLEGLHFLTSGGDIRVLSAAAQRRGEIIDFRTRNIGSERQQFELAHFFNGHRLILDKPLDVRGDNGYSPIEARVSAPNGQGGGYIGGASGTAPTRILVIQSGSAEQHHSIRFEVSQHGGVRTDFWGLPGSGKNPLDQFFLSDVEAQDSTFRFVGTDTLDSLTLSAMWDKLVRRGEEAEINTAMRILAPEFESVQMLAGMLPNLESGSRAGIVVGLKGQEGRIPLGSMGEGMRRIMGLAICIACAKSGAVFIDEIDTGLHYSVLADMWKLVVTKAIESNIQVFATTHSWDCIEGLSALCQSNPEFMDKVAVHKIDRAIPHSIPFDGKSLVGMVRSDIDPR